MHETSTGRPSRVAAQKRMLQRLYPALLPAVCHAARLYLQKFPLAHGKTGLWDTCSRYLAWRSLAFEVPTSQGFRMKTLFGGSVPVHIFFWGIWEPGISQLMEHTLRPGDTFIDVGANIGYHSLLASKLVGQTGVVIALEPAPQIRAQLLENVRLNPDIQSWANIRVVPYCALETETDVTFHVVTEGNTGLSGVREVPGSTPILVKAQRLDDILSGQDLSHCRLLKMDIEGSEFRALLGMDKILERHTDLSLIIEIAPAYLIEAGSSAEEIFDHLQRKGYSAFIVDSAKVNPYKRPLVLRPVRQVAPNAQREFNVLFTRVPHKFQRFVVNASEGAR